MLTNPNLARNQVQIGRTSRVAAGGGIKEGLVGGMREPEPGGTRSPSAGKPMKTAKSVRALPIWRYHDHVIKWANSIYTGIPIVTL
jgi:hypothetical protein